MRLRPIGALASLLPMHPAAADYARQVVADFGPFASVVEVGSRDINGTIRHLFGKASYVGLDLYAGPGVDVVGDAAEYEPPAPVDAVVCCEVYEHTAAWPELIRRAHDWLAPSGVLIVTCAGPGRRPHSALDGGWKLHPGEHYRNVEPSRMAEVMRAEGFRSVVCENVGRDTRGVAVA